MEGFQFIQPMWGKVESGEQFIGVLQKLVAGGKLPEKLLPLWVDFYNNYNNALINSEVPGNTAQYAAKVQATIADVVLNQFVDPYVFPSFHQRLLEPYNYYEFGQRYVGSLIDFNNSLLGHKDRWDTVNKLLANKENVVLLANHQTEADPGVFAHMLASIHPNLATDVIYVAGDRVVTDPLCKPFSMGRNLFCVHSKKHLGDQPELKAAKMETNRKTLVAMQRALNAGGVLIWIAPSGGRDRPKNGAWSPDPFDPAAVELMRNLVSRAKRPGHLYPMAMYSYPMMPPPTTIDKSIGERRLTNFTPVGISLCEELDVAAIIDGSGEKEEQQQQLATAAWEKVCDSYSDLEKAIKDVDYRQTKTDVYVQPWL